MVPTLSSTAPSAGTWTWAYETNQAEGQYTLRTTIVDTADNRVNSAAGGQDTQVVIVDTSGGTVQPSGLPDANTSAGVDITAMTTDTGVSASDFITSDNTLTYSGTVTGFTNNGDQVKLELLDSTGVVIATQYVVPTLSGIAPSAGTWSWAYQTTQTYGQYTLRATIVDTADNRVNTATVGQDTQVVIVDTVPSTTIVTITAVNDNVGLIQGVVANNGKTDDTGLNLTGGLSTALVTGESVLIYDGSTYLGVATVTGTTWTFSDSRILTDTQIVNYIAVISDIANEGTPSATYTVTVDLTPPVLVITSIAGDALSSGVLFGTYNVPERGTILTTVVTKPVISGTTDAEVGQTVSVTLNDKNYTSVVSSDHTWSIELNDADAIALNHGNTYSIVAAVMDQAGLSAVVTDKSMVINIAYPDTPTVNQKKTGSTTPILTGMAEKVDPNHTNAYIPLATGDTLEFTINGVSYRVTIGGTVPGIDDLGFTYNSGTGQWSLDTALSSTSFNLLDHTIYDVSVIVTTGTGTNSATNHDISSNELRINSTPPVITLDVISGDSIVSALEAGQDLVITGTTTAAVGSIVTITGLDGTSRTAIVIAGTSGNVFSLTIQSTDVASFSVGDKTVTATVVNDYGVSNNDTENVLIDIVAPTTTVQIVEIDDNIGAVTGIVANGGYSDDTQLAVAGTLSAPLLLGESLKVYDGSTYLGLAIVTGSTWTFSDTRTLIDTQTVNYTARVFDGANYGADSNLYSATIDLTPAATVDDTATAAEQGGITNGINPSGNVLTNDIPGAGDTFTVIQVEAGANSIATTGLLTIAGLYGTVTIAADGSYTYTVDQTNATVQALINGSTPLSDVFTYTVKNSTTNSTNTFTPFTKTGLLTISINGVNDYATFSGDTSIAITESNVAQTVTGTLSVADVDNPATVTAQTSVAGSAGLGKFTITTAGVWTYVMDNAQNQLNTTDVITDSLTVTTADGTTQEIRVVITGTNDAAVIVGAITGAVIEAGGVSNGVPGTRTATGTLTSTDIDGTANLFTEESNGTSSYGNFLMSTAGVWTYNLNNSNSTVDALVAGATLSDSFTVTAADGTAQLISVTITGSNDNAFITGTSTGAITEDAVSNTAGSTLTVADVDTGQAVFQTPSSLLGTYGTYTFNTNTGVWGYTLDNTKASVQALTGTGTNHIVTDTLVVTSQDGTATRSLVVTITGVNDQPISPASVTMTGLEDAAIPVGAVGSTIASLTGLSGTDPEGATVGLAFVAPIASTYGTVYYSVNNGSTWIDLTAASASFTINNALVLGSSTRLYIKGTALNFNGTLATTSVRLWDGTDGATSNSTKNISTLTGATGAYSASNTTLDLVVTAVNDAPVNTVPVAQTAIEDTAKVITGLQIADVDAGTGNMTVTLSAVNGTITMLAGAGTVTLGNNGTSSVTLTGKLADINTLLALSSAVTYKGNLNYNGTDTLTMLTSDNGNTGTGNILTDSDTVAITLSAVNDGPVNTVPVAQTTLEDTPLVITGLQMADVDSTTGMSVTLSVTTGILNVLAGTGVTITTNGTASVKLAGTQADINALLATTNAVTFTPVANSTVSVTLTMLTSDGVLTDSDTVAITITPVNDAPTLATTSTLAYTENNVATAINTAITVADIDNTTLASATVSITSGFESADVLSFTNASMGNIVGSYDAATGVMTLSSAGATATLAQWQLALRAVKYNSTSDNTATLSRTVSYQVNDGALNSTVVTSTINMTKVNDAPVNTVPGAQTTIEDTPLVITGLQMADVDSTTGMSVTLSVTTGILNVLAGTGVTITTNGTASVKLAGTQADINALLATTNAVTFTPVANSTAAVTLTMLTSDGVLTDSDTVAITITPVNDAPVVTPSVTSVVFTENAVTAVVINSLMTLSDVDSANLTGATVSISSATYTAGDTLNFTTQNGITGTYSAGTLTLTGSATVANYQAALRSITYITASNAPTAISATRTINWQVDDGQVINHASNVGTSNVITINAVNDAPVNTVPTAQSAGVGTVTAITGLSIADSDAISGNMTVTLSLTAGVGVINVSGGTATIASGNGTNSVVLTGTVADINSTLAASVTYTLATGAPASTTLTMLTSDNGNTGSGGTLTDTDTVTIAAQTIVISTVQASSTAAPAVVTNTFDSTTAWRPDNSNPPVTSLTSGSWLITTSGTTSGFDTGSGGRDGLNYANSSQISASNQGGNFLQVDMGGAFVAYTGWAKFAVPNGEISGSLSFELTCSPGGQNDKLIKFYDANGTQVGANQTLSFSSLGNAVWSNVSFTVPTVAGSAVNYFTITGGNAVSYWIDNLKVTQAITTATTINNAETSTTGTSTSVTPLTVNGTLAVALGVNEVVEVFRNGVSIGNATVTGTTWKIVDSTLNTVQVDLYEARVKNTSTSAVVTDSNDYVINPLTLAISSAQGNEALSDSFTSAATSSLLASTSTALWNVSYPSHNLYQTANSYVDAGVWGLSGGMLEMGPTKATGSSTATFTLKGGATFSGLTYLTGYGTSSTASTSLVTVNFYSATNTLLGTKTYTLSADAVANNYNFSYSFTGEATYFTITTDGNNAYAIDNVAYTPGATSFSIASGGTMVDTTPVLNGTIPRALAAGETVDIFLDGATTPVGSATIAVGATAWTWTQPTALTAATHSFIAKIKSGGAYIGSSTAFSVVVASTPLVLDLNSDGVQTVGLAAGVQFDLLNTGKPVNVGWVDKHDGLLVMDLNGDGIINNGAELFGDHTVLADGTLAKDGWAALSAQDSNHDGKIDVQDANFNKLGVWVDANGNGSTDVGELHTLAEEHIASINLNHDNSSVQQNGNVVQMASSFTTTDGVTHSMADVGLKVQNATSTIYTLSMGESLDLSGLGNAAQVSGINMSTDSAANIVKLTLTDVLNTTVTNGLHQLTLTGDANDSVQLSAHEWTNTGTTVTESEHTYAVYNATTSSEAQLLIDQAMINAGHVM